MAKISKTARASAVAAEVRQERKLTPDEAIAEIRRLLDAKLFVGNMDYVRLLLAAYDQRGVDLGLARADIARLNRDELLRAQTAANDAVDAVDAIGD